MLVQGLNFLCVVLRSIGICCTLSVFLMELGEVTEMVIKKNSL